MERDFFYVELSGFDTHNDHHEALQPHSLHVSLYGCVSKSASLHVYISLDAHIRAVFTVGCR